MTTEPLEDDEMDPILIEAVDWFIRLTSGEATQDDADGLAAWRAQSAAHEAAFQSLTGLRTVSRAMGREGDTIHRRGIFVGGAAVLAGVATYGLARPPLGLWPSFAELTADHRTGLGQQFDFEPMTGVHVAMNARTSVSVADQGRAIRLIRGEAFISVAHRKTPFVVDTQLARVETFESRFNLRSLGGAVEVTCVAGALLCRRAGRRDSVQAGEALAIKSDGRPALAAADPAVATAWLQGLLIFKGTPLSEVVEQINLYRPGRIILTNAAVGRRPVVGIFHTSQIENAVGQIQQLLGLSLRRLPGDIVLIG